MGLAAPKNKIKLSHDPNNTRWTSDKSSFGHKIMTTQGWKPGEYLGARDAAHAEYHTAANASHIRVSIKDNNLGLGAKIGSGVGHGECTGLDAFKNLLGRLNGKDEDEIQKEQRQRDDIRRAVYTEKRWGSVRFVSAGFLIGDKIQVLIDAEAKRIRKLAKGVTLEDSQNMSNSSSETEEMPVVEKPKQSKKRKADAIEETEADVAVTEVKKSKKKRKTDTEPEGKVMDAVTEASKGVEISQKKSKKDKKSEKERISETNEESRADSNLCKEVYEIKRRKREKKEKKERKNKEKAGPVASYAEDGIEKKSKKSKREKHNSEPSTKESTPATPLTVETSGQSTPMMHGRHAVRSRFIAQKRLASMDVAALNQIFMIKAQS